MNSKGELGRRGEAAALDYLRGIGLNLISRNWRSGHLEVDLVMEDAASVRIVEVKTLNAGDGFDPGENVTADKRRKLIRAARAFYVQHPTFKEIKFDVVTVLVCDGEVVEVNYMPDAFDALG
ncbi:MAG: YraN family protein [Bacteroidales bacterium]|nr:YraN family protein [Bacteroidales bacterium]